MAMIAELQKPPRFKPVEARGARGGGARAAPCCGTALKLGAFGNRTLMPVSTTQNLFNKFSSNESNGSPRRRSHELACVENSLTTLERQENRLSGKLIWLGRTAHTPKAFAVGIFLHGLEICDCAGRMRSGGLVSETGGNIGFTIACRPARYWL